MVIVDLDSATKSSINIRLFRNVKNVKELHQKVIKGQIQCSLVNPKLILDPFQLVIAANKAITSKHKTTKTIFTELLFNLSISKHITKSLQQFGINENCTDLLVVKFEGFNDDNKDISSEIVGEEVEIRILEEIADVNAIKNAYKIKGNEEKSTALLDSIVSRIATKDFISY